MTGTVTVSVRFYERMKKIVLYLKSHPRTIFGGALLFLFLGGAVPYLLGRGGEDELFVVAPGPFAQQVSVSGTVVATDEVDLSFADSGRIEQIAVKVGDKVVRGQELASLSMGTLLADLRSAQADLALKRAEANNTEVSLDRLRKQQDALVASAYRTLLSEGLVAVPSSNTVTAVAPVLTGLYEGPEGAYKISVDRTKQISLNNAVLSTFDLERTGPIDVLDTEPTPLGTRGLFIDFPDDLEDYFNTTWYVTIPNTKSSQYQINYNAYQEALRTREKEISAAEEELRRETTEATIAEAGIARAEAAVARVEAQIRDRVLYAPFAGVVTDIPIKLGGNAAANASAITLISNATLQVESFVPEINIPLIAVGDSAIVTLDAYGSTVPFEAKVVFIDPAETVRDGVSTYRAKLEFIARDERVRSGMTANVTITTENKESVISVPKGIVFDRDGKNYVRVMIGGEPVEREVILGSVSSVGQVEIVSGLIAGEQVLLSVE